MKKSRKILALLLSVVMLLGVLPVTAIAAETSGMDNFKKVNTYSADLFSDVSDSDWFVDNVKTAYELGLMIGQGKQFGVASDITIAETVTLAARLHSIYYGNSDSLVQESPWYRFFKSAPWYQVYVDYVSSKNLVSLDGLDMTAPATRAQFASILAASLPAEALERINNVADNAIPDVDIEDDCAEAVYALYRAGVLIGNNSEGKFAPESNIKRNEVAAVVTRMADASLRRSITLGDFYSVTFISEGSIIFTQTVSSGNSITQPSTPTRQGYSFVGWYSDSALSIPYNFSSAVTSNITLYAKWEQSEVLRKTVITLTSPELELVNGENGKYYYLDSKLEQLTGTMTYIENVKEFNYRVSDSNDNTLKEGSIPVSEKWVCDDISFIFGYNRLVLSAELKGNESVITGFDIINGSSLNEKDLEIEMTTDSDGDSIPDYYEEILGTDSTQADTDGDGLADYLEYLSLGLSPLIKDTDENGIEDGAEDYDADGLANLYECNIGTNPCVFDTDADKLSDGEEINIYRTNPLVADTDADGVDDATEIEMGTNPLVFNSSFDCTYGFPGTGTGTVIKPMVTIQGLSAEQVCELSISEVKAGSLANPNIPGYISSAFIFSEIGNFDSAVISFEVDPTLFENEDFEPAIYWYDEENEILTKVDNQIITGNTVSAVVTHFSKYIVLNSKKYDEIWETELLYDEDGQEAFQAIDVVFLLDTSGSMDWNDPGYGRRTVTKNFIDHLTENDLAAVIGFDSYSEIYSGFTSDRETLYQALNQIDNYGGTSLSAGISAALSLFTSSSYEGTDRLKCIIMLTDGDGDYSTSYTLQAVNLNVVIYTVGLGNDVSTTVLRSIAEGTGGAYYHASRADDLNAIFERIADESDLYKDTDYDGLSDYFEKEMANGNLRLGTGIQITGINYLIADSDNDGLMDGQEISVRKVDNRIFVSMKSNPTMSDSDSDGIDDGDDLLPLTPNLSNILLYQSDKLPGKDVDGDDALDLACGDEGYLKLLSHGPVFAVANITPEFLIWKEFSWLLGFCTKNASDDIKAVKDEMYKRFRAGIEGEYSNTKLTEAVLNYTGDASVQRTMDEVRRFVEKKLKENGGDLSALIYDKNAIDRKDSGSISYQFKDSIDKAYFQNGLFSEDVYNGFTILIHDFHGFTVTISDYKLTNNSFSGKIHFHYYDHFGLGPEDSNYLQLPGFCDWYTLQHYNRFEKKYKPFITVFDFPDVEFYGSF